MDILEMIRDGKTDSLVVVKLADLQSFARDIVGRAISATLYAEEKNNERKAKAENKKLVTREEAAKMLNKALCTLRRWEQAKYLMPVRKGGSVMYRESDVLALMGQKPEKK